MGTIVERQRKDGTPAFLAKIQIMRDGAIVHREAKTFDRRPAATAWIAKRERELATPGEIERAKTPRVTLAQAIDRYLAESRREPGRTKTQVLATVKGYALANMECAAIRSEDVVAFAQELAVERQPQTVANYLSHIGSIFAIARPAWGYPLDRQAMEDAVIVARRLGVIGRSRSRHRRPTLAELDVIMEWFGRTNRKDAVPMDRIVAFAIFSTRRQEEITRITWADLDEAHSRILVRDMKNPGEKIGNDIWCDLPPEALAIIKAMPRRDARIFPHNPDTLSANFTRGTAVLGIEDLHFHDLRHEGVTRLFELGRTIPQVASVSGHRSWQSLKRYTHLKEAGDKYAGWKWLDVVSRPRPHTPEPVRDCAQPGRRRK